MSARDETDVDLTELDQVEPEEVRKRDEPGDAGTSDAPTAPRSRVRQGHRWARLAMAVALAASVVAAGYATWGAHRVQQVEEVRDEALAAARTRVPVLLSYQQSRLDDDLALAIEQTTGPFRDDYGTLLRDAVAPTAEERQISTRAEVASAGVVSATRDRVVVLVFLTQTTTSGGQEPTTSANRVEVSMELDGEDWKIAGLLPT